MIDGIATKSKMVTIPVALKPKALAQLHSDDMDIEKTGILVSDLVHCKTMNKDIEKTLKMIQYALDFNRHNQNQDNPSQNPRQTVGSDKH